MITVTRVLRLAATVLVLVSASGAGASVNYQGHYGASGSGGKAGLTLEQRGQQVGGILHINGIPHQLSGEIGTDGRVQGTGRSAAGVFYFVGQKNGNQLLMMLANPDGKGGVNMKSARNITFTANTATMATAPVQGVPQAAASGSGSALPSLKQCNQMNSECMARCSKTAKPWGCTDEQCTPAYNKCTAGRRASGSSASSDKTFVDSAVRQSQDRMWEATQDRWKINEGRSPY